MQPLDDIFSSPDKESRAGADDDDDDDDEEEEIANGQDETDEEPMDIDEGQSDRNLTFSMGESGLLTPLVTAPAPSAFMNGRPPARARSPPKTSLNSPARRAPGLASSSPLRASNDAQRSPSGVRPMSVQNVQRRLDFKNNPLANKPVLPRPNGVNGHNKASANGLRRSSEDEQDEQDGPEEFEEPEDDEESLAMLDGAGDDSPVEDDVANGEPEPEDEEEEQEEAPTPPPSAKKSRGRPKKPAAPPADEDGDAIVESIEEDAEPSAKSPPRVKKRPRGPQKPQHVDDEDRANEHARKKAKKNATHGDQEDESSGQAVTAASAPKRRGRKPKAAAAAAAAEPPQEQSTGLETARPGKKAATQKPKRLAKRTSAGVGDTSVADVPRGPPLPQSRGLVITRREAPGAGSGLTTRSGRASYQPLSFWRNERVELDDDALVEDGKTQIVLPHVKNIVRVDEPEREAKSGTRRKGRAGRKAGRSRGGLQEEDDEDDLEPWEKDGDIITGDVVEWKPDHEFNPPGPDDPIDVLPDEQIAVSANAITTKEIRNASFKFAKTLSTPFFGSGVVDLPPGTEKKPKNSRKMHMTFFVFSGRVTVTVGDTLFSIGRGGMWFVPRGKHILTTCRGVCSEIDGELTQS